jgi:cytochrome c556
MNKILLCVALLGMGGIYGARAGDPLPTTADELIATRQADMAIQTSLLESIMMAIGAEADILPLKDAADAIEALGMAIPDLFPEGTERGHNTRARPAVWSDRAGFEKAAANLTEAARRMADAAATDNRPEFAKANLATVAACSVCHMAYRGARIKP